MSKRESFRYFIDNKTRIVIPAIQRDYAEGRKTKRIDKISSEILESMLEVVAGRKPSEKLNFVYGYEQNDKCSTKTIIPLDGQQRLTTLFLLYWFFCENDDLKIDYGKGDKSLFSYAARTTSEDFCNALVLRCAKDLYIDYKLSNEEEYDFSNYILKRGWFQYTWRNDPTVSSMLNILSKVARMTKDKEFDINEWHNYYKRLDNIQFDFEDLEAINAGEELYVKMNARGKPLSSFDLLKSDLEEELQENIVCMRKRHEDTTELEKIEREWRKKFNTSWMQYFWRISNKDNERTIETERLFENLLQNLVYFDACEQDQSIESIKSKKESPFDSYKRIKKEEEWNGGLSFSNYISTIDSLIINSQICDVNIMDGGDIVHPVSDNEDDNIENEEKRLINRLLRGDSVEYFDLAYLYALIRFLRIEGLSSTEIIEDAKKEKALKTWMGFVHNVWSPDNSGYSMIDKPNKLKAVIRFIDTLLGNYNADSDVNDLIINIDEDEGPLLDISLEEEKIKARIRKNDDDVGAWHALFNDSLKDKFLNGQIISILLWSKDNTGKYEFTKAKNYYNKLKQLTEKKEYFYKLMLLHGDYREYSKLDEDSCGSLLPFTGRERSVKNYLREKKDGEIAIHLKEILDEWPVGKTIDEFVEEYTNKNVESINDWRQFFIDYYDWYVFLKPGDKKWRYKLMDDKGICFVNVKENEKQDVVYEYICNKINKMYESKKASVKRSKNEFYIPDEDVTIETIGGGEYIFIHGGNEKKCNNYQELMEILNSIISIKP